MKKNKKITKYLILIGVAAFMGLLFSFLKQNDYWYRLRLSLLNFKWYLYPITVIIFMFLIVLVHELGHFFSFVFNKVKIRALIIWIFSLYKTDKNKWKFTIEFKNYKFIGGIVVPSLEEVTNDNKFNELKEKFAKALIAGPNTSIGYFVFSVLIFVIVWFFTPLISVLAPIFVNLTISTLLTTVIVLSSRVHTDELYGDYPAYKLMKENNRFQIIQILQYSGFSLFESEETYLYFYNYINAFYSKEGLSYDFFDLVLLTNYMHLYIHNDFSLNETVTRVVNYYSINRLSRSKHGLELSYLISAYYYKEDRVEKAFELFNIISNNQNDHLEEDKKLLLLKKFEHLMNLSDNKAVFENMKKVILKDFFVLYQIINIDEVIDELNKKLEFKEYYTKLYCRIDRSD